jgi:mannosyltransferase
MGSEAHIVPPVLNRRDWGILALVIVAGGLIRFLTLGHQSYDHDEAVTAARVLQPGFGGMMHVVAHGERSPPLYYALAWLWSKPFGSGEIGLRSLSALFGTLTIPIAYRATIEFGSRRAGLIAASLVAFNPYLIWYSQEARSYALLVLFSAIALLYFARSIKTPGSRPLGLWAAASGLSLCSHYFAVFLVVPEAIWLLIAHGRRRGPVLAVTAVAVVGLALLPYAVHQEGGNSRNGFTQQPLAERAGETLLNFVASEEPSPLAGNSAVDAVQVVAAAGAGLLLLVALALALTSGGEPERRGVIALGGVGVASVLVPLLLAAIGFDYINPRNLIGAVIPLLAAAAIGFGVARANIVGLVGGVAGCLLFIGVDAAVYSSAQMQRPDWRQAADAIGPSPEPRILVINHNGDDPLTYYLGAEKLSRKTEPRRGVREIDVLSTAYRVREPGHGFKLERVQGLAPLFILRTFRSDHPVYVRPKQVRGRRVLQERSSVLLAGAPSP